MMTRRIRHVWPLLCIIAVMQAEVIVRCDACARGECGTSGEGCCQGMAAEPECPLCRASLAESRGDDERRDRPPCRCAWRPRTDQPMTAEHAAPVDLDEGQGILTPPQHSGSLGRRDPRAGGWQPAVPIPERPARILYGVWRN